MSNKEFLTTKELAVFFNTSLATIYRLIEGRRIPFYKIGRSIRFKMEDIQKYLEDNRVDQIIRKQY